MYSIGREYNFANPYQWLKEYLKDGKDHYIGYYCRGACVGEGDEAKMVIAIIEAIPSHSNRSISEIDHVYDNVSLFREMWNHKKLLEELARMEQGRLPWGPFPFKSAENQQWRKEQLPLKNDYMSSAGYMLSTTFVDNAYLPGEILVRAGQPYYSNTEEAVKDCIDLVQYHGNSDGRNGQIIFLFPEVRAYFSDIHVDDDEIELHIDGTMVDSAEFLVSGAWWSRDGIHHFEKNVSEGRANLTVPRDSDRLEYVLIDRMNRIYDYQSEYGDRHTGLGRRLRSSVDDALTKLLAEALQHGEGERYEYKEFVAPPDKKKGGKLQNEKFYEILKTVCAFSNNVGGSIFIGINDDCEVVGVRGGLARLKHEEATIAVVNEYSTAIKTGIRDFIVGVHELSVEHVSVNSEAIVIVRVGKNPNMDTHIKDENVVYYRRGSNNTKIPPHDWRNYVCGK